MGLPNLHIGGSVVKISPANAGDIGSTPGSGRSPGEGNGYPLSHFAWEMPWTEEPGGFLGFCPWDYKRAKHDLVTNSNNKIYILSFNNSLRKGLCGIRNESSNSFTFRTSSQTLIYIFFSKSTSSSFLMCLCSNRNIFYIYQGFV